MKDVKLNIVHLGGLSINNTITSKETILDISKEIIAANGMQALNMRAVAIKCGVAVGSVYNYFPSKGDLIIASIQSIWAEIMRDFHCVDTSSFAQNVQLLFDRVQAGTHKYPLFFTTHFMGVATIDKGKARNTMLQYFAHIKKSLAMSLEHDKDVKAEIFNGNFSQNEFVDFVFANVLNLLMQGEGSCLVLIEIIKRIIY